MSHPLHLLSALALALAACGHPSTGAGDRGPADARVGAAAPTPAPVADAAPAPAPVTWRGPNLYTLGDDQVTVAVSLRPPGGWAEDTTDDHERLTSPAGSLFEVWLVAGRAPVTTSHTARSSHHEYAIPGAGEHLVACGVTLVDADLALLDELTRQCDELSFEYEPDARAGWKLEIEPATVSLADLDRVTVRYHVTNQGAAPLDAHAYALAWQVDGVESMALDMAFGNGGYASSERAVAPGASITASRRGVAFVDAPGSHVVTLMHLDHELARATVRVRP
ncbi:MAG: hypothetical protein H6709_01560 [Kofleriaceae bacterium]|nr:hypothetical protein [Kofleriaceae bacterium]MCB9570756.1 hypothetical protein [Kofleriaceae bacterium]